MAEFSSDNIRNIVTAGLGHGQIYLGGQLVAPAKGSVEELMTELSVSS